ncbi:MAG: chemotaxis protein CheX [Bacillota bacterium]|jgi:chemotaxis protein CheX
MTAKLYDSFLEATRNVFHLMLDLSDISDRPAETFKPEDELDISVEIVGDLVGKVIYRFPGTTSLNIVKIMSGMEIETVDDFVISAMSEISNIISGNVLTMLAADNLKCDIGTPQLHKSDDGKMYLTRTTCCISTSAGDVGLDIRLNPIA